MALPVVVTRGIGGQVYMDPTTGKIIGPAYTPPPSYSQPDPGYFKIVQPTNAPTTQAISPSAIIPPPAEPYPLARWGITPQQSYDFRSTTDTMHKDYGYLMGQMGLTAEEAAWVMGDSDAVPDSVK